MKENIVFQHCQFLSALGKSVIKSLINFEPVLKGTEVSFFDTYATSILGNLESTHRSVGTILLSKGIGSLLTFQNNPA